MIRIGGSPSPSKTAGTPRGTVLPSRLELPRRKTWASLNPSWRVPLGPPSCTTTARGMSRGGFFFKASSSRLRLSSRDRSSAGSIACPLVRGSQNGPRAESSSSYSSASGSLGGVFGSAGSNQRGAQFGFDLPALGFVELPVVDADLRELAAEPRAAAGARPTQIAAPRWPGRTRRASMPFLRTGRRSVAVQRRAAAGPR